MAKNLVCNDSSDSKCEREGGEDIYSYRGEDIYSYRGEDIYDRGGTTIEASKFDFLVKLLLHH